MLVYFPKKTSIPTPKCFISETKAKEFSENDGGNLVSFPTFESKNDAKKWIKEQDTQGSWIVNYFNNTILADDCGEPLEEQTTKRNPGEPHARSISFEKPDYIYCVYCVEKK